MPHKRKKARHEKDQLAQNTNPSTIRNPENIYEIRVSTPSPEPLQNLPMQTPTLSHNYIPTIPVYRHNQPAITTTSIVTTTTTTTTYTTSAQQLLMSIGVNTPKPSSTHSEPPLSTHSSSSSEDSEDTDTDNSYPSDWESAPGDLFPPKTPIKPYCPTPDSKESSPPINTVADNQASTISVPSIFIYTPIHFKELIAQVQAKVKPSPQFKLHRNSIECIPRSSEAHRQTLTWLSDHSIEHYSLNEKQNRPAKLAIKYIPPDIGNAEIAADLAANHLSFHTISRIMQSRNGEKFPSNILIISTTPAQVPRYLNLATLCNILITVEPYIRKDIPQCHRCQGFGHSSQLCRRTHKCVKCGGAHAGAPCEAAACKCANCGSGHPASYKGCPVYLETKARFHRNDSTNISLSTSINSQTLPNQSTFATPCYTSTPRPSHNRESTLSITSPPTPIPSPSLSQPQLPIQPSTQIPPPNNEPNIFQSIADLIKSINTPYIIQIIQTIKNIFNKIKSADNLLEKITILLESIATLF